MKWRAELFFFLLRTNRRGGGSGAALRGTSLCCVNACWAFIWQYLTHGRRCTRMSHNSKPDRLNSTYCTGNSNRAGAKRGRSFYFAWSLEYGWSLPVLASPRSSPPSLLLLPPPAHGDVCRILDPKSYFKRTCRWSCDSGDSLGQLCSEPAAYLEARIAAAGTLKSFCLHKHLGPTRGWIAAW